MEITIFTGFISFLIGFIHFITGICSKRNKTIIWVSPNKKDYTDISSIKDKVGGENYSFRWVNKANLPRRTSEGYEVAYFYGLFKWNKYHYEHNDAILMRKKRNNQ